MEHLSEYERFCEAVENCDTEDNVKDIAVTANFYKTFAPKTCEHLLKYIKDGNYNNTSLVMDITGSYLVLGSINYTENGYEEIKGADLCDKLHSRKLYCRNQRDDVLRGRALRDREIRRSQRAFC